MSILVRLVCICTALLVVVSCENESDPASIKQGTLTPVDTVSIVHKDLGATIYGPRLVLRGSNRRICLIDDAHVYAEFDLKTGERTDRIDLRRFIERAGVSIESVVNTIHWLSESEAIVTVLAPAPCFVYLDLKDSTSKYVDPEIITDSYRGAMPFSISCSAEQLTIDSMRFMSAAQVHSGALQHSSENRKRKYSQPPLVIYSISADGRVQMRAGIGAFPQIYRDEFVRMMQYTFDVNGDEGLLAFESSPTVYFFSVNEKSIIDSVALNSSVEVSVKPFTAKEESAKTVREYYFTTSRSPILKWYTSDRFLRSWIPGREMSSDGIVDREFDKMDWVIGCYRRHGSSKPVEYKVNGEHFYNTFMEVEKNNVLLRAVSDEFGITTLVKMQLNSND